MKTLFTFCILFILTSCVSYDKAIIYHPDYSPGQHPLLRFDGFYSDTLFADTTYYGLIFTRTSIKPKFFYSDGTSILGQRFSNQDSLSAYLKRGWNNIGMWSNYKISQDTIVLEYFSHDGGTGNYDRFIETGIILQDKIYFPSQTIRDGVTHKSYYAFFHRFDTKPDSSMNWIRTNKYYSKRTK